MPRPLPRRGDDGTAALVSFAVVLVIFVTSFAAFLSVVESPAHGSAEAAVLDGAASAGLVEVMDTAGYYVNGGTKAKAWNLAPDKMTRFGLSVEGAPGFLDLAKMRNATRGGLALDAGNGLLDYEEARAALDLGEADFHLRTEPLWDPLAAAGVQPLQGLNVSYLGDFSWVTTGASNYPVQNASAILDGGDHVFVNLTIVNNGTVTTMFQVQFRLDLAEEELTDSANTPMLAPGEQWNVSLRLRKSALWTWEDLADQNVHVKVYDPVKKVGDLDLALAPLQMNTGANLDRVALTVNPQRLTYFSNQFPKVRWQYWAEDGEPENAPSVNVTVRDSAGTAVAYFQGDNTGQEFQLPDKLAEGRYNVSIRLVSDAALTNNDTLVVEDDGLGQFTADPTSLVESTASRWERGLLATLVQGFKNTTYNVSSGHVYMDQLQVTDGALATNLTAGLFDVLFVGSGVDHAALAGQSAKEAVKDFVEGGGLLVVLGSADQQATWLQPLFTGSTASQVGVDQQDPSHPVLHAPEELDHGRYLDGGRVWRLDTPGDGGHFTHVLGTRANGAMEDVLAVSRPGHFGDGNVLLTAWQLAALTSTLDRGEAISALYNFLLFASGALYLDLGPAVPEHAEVASAARIATAPHPVLAGQRILVSVTLYVFR